jgi:hypothetical protein
MPIVAQPSDGTEFFYMLTPPTICLRIILYHVLDTIKQADLTIFGGGLFMIMGGLTDWQKESLKYIHTDMIVKRYLYNMKRQSNTKVPTKTSKSPHE